MNLVAEWYRLGYLLEQDSYQGQSFENQYFNRLASVLDSTNVEIGDIASAYRDAFLASPSPGDGQLRMRKATKNDVDRLRVWGLKVNASGQYLSLEHTTREFQFSSRYGINLDPIYSLEQRRHIHPFPIDPVLRQKIAAADYENYQGAGQRTAVRLALTEPNDATLLVNLPTGVGKTLVVYALSAFMGDRRLTLVIVPTIGLAIDQGTRAKQHFEKVGNGHGGVYYWYGQQDKLQQADIRERILAGQQRILFCSPESAIRSLLPILFEAAKSELLGSVVVDEAHLVDQWGVEFRPHFQIFAALLNKFRDLSSGNIKCILMSATLSEKTVRNLTELFSTGGVPCVEIHGGFLRPEPQYSTLEVAKEKHLDELVHAACLLPKPLIIYTTLPNHAAEIEQALKERLHINRLRTFTGHTNARQRESILQSWNNDELDVIVATSAFGVGMDKPNVRSVLHACTPENIDRYYQEVGRAGRDGRACQALLVYHHEQLKLAERINTKRLISVDIGYDRWLNMWNLGDVAPGGRRIVDVRTLRGALRRRSDSNIGWNWRTLLLMQRSGLIQIEFEEPNPPEQVAPETQRDYEERRRLYYDDYFGRITVEPIIGSHLKLATWQHLMAKQRHEELIGQQEGYRRLRKWIDSPLEVPLCKDLAAFYRCHGIEPEYTCGGCPACRRQGKQSISPTVGLGCTVVGHISPGHWSPPIVSDHLHLSVYYDETRERSLKQLIRRWRGWISRLIESGAIQAIRAEPEILELLNQRLSRGLDAFWVGIELDDTEPLQNLWRELTIVSPDASTLPTLGWEDSARLIVAPMGITHPNHFQCKWWERDYRAKPLSSFVTGLDYVAY